VLGLFIIYFGISYGIVYILHIKEGNVKRVGLRGVDAPIAESENCVSDEAAP
jgi:hypothetical protein